MRGRLGPWRSDNRPVHRRRTGSCRSSSGSLQETGYEGFRDARGPLGLTQRQGGGKFTRDEADTLIAQLQDGRRVGR